MLTSPPSQPNSCARNTSDDHSPARSSSKSPARWRRSTRRRRGRNRSGMAIPAPCTCGGHGGHWRRRAAPDPGPEPKLDDILAEAARNALFKIIEDLVLWENTRTKKSCKRRAMRFGNPSSDHRRLRHTQVSQGGKPGCSGATRATPKPTARHAMAMRLTPTSSSWMKPGRALFSRPESRGGIREGSSGHVAELSDRLSRPIWRNAISTRSAPCGNPKARRSSKKY